MKVVITGGEGFLGQHLTRALVEKYPDADIVVLDIRRNPYPLSVPENANLIRRTADVTQAETLAPHFRDADVVFNLVGCVSFSIRHKDRLYELNTEAARTIGQLCVVHSVHRLVHVSSVASLGYSNDAQSLVNEDHAFDFGKIPHKHYALSKRKGEELLCAAVEAEGLQAVIVCPAWMWGAGDYLNTSRGISGMKAGQWQAGMHMPGGSYLADVEDIAHGLIAAMEKGTVGERYILGGYNYTFREINEIMAEVLAVRGPRWSMPRWLHRPIYAAFALAERLSRKPLAVTSDNIDSAFMFRYYDHRKANEQLGWKASKPFSQTLREQIAYLQSYGLLS